VKQNRRSCHGEKPSNARRKEPMDTSYRKWSHTIVPGHRLYLECVPIPSDHRENNAGRSVFMACNLWNSCLCSTTWTINDRKHTGRIPPAQVQSGYSGSHGRSGIGRRVSFDSLYDRIDALDALAFLWHSWRDRHGNGLYDHDRLLPKVVPG